MALRDVAMCSWCIHHLAEADRLRKKLARVEAQNRRLKELLGKRNRTPHEKPFGSSTSFSKLTHKPGADDAAKARQGGAKAGHPGHGRRPHAHLPELPELTVSADCACPDCQGILEKPSCRMNLEKEFPGQAEVAAFVKALKPKLKAAMRLRRNYTNLALFHQRARRLKAAIQEIVNRPARHAGVQSYQVIFRENPDKLYH